MFRDEGAILQAAAMFAVKQLERNIANPQNDLRDPGQLVVATLGSFARAGLIPERLVPPAGG